MPNLIEKEVIGLEEEGVVGSELAITQGGEQASEAPDNLPLPLGDPTRAGAASRPDEGGRGEGRPGATAVGAYGHTPLPGEGHGEVTRAPAEAEVERLKGELAEVHARMLASCRRALLAENAGRIVPELVTGSTVEEMEGSLEPARRAFETARALALAEMASAPVPAGNPIRQGPAVDGMSPIEKIAYGLKRD